MQIVLCKACGERLVDFKDGWCDIICLHMNRQNSLKAFTLIELLVVIAIIGILSSVVLASLSGARESARMTRMASDLEQIETAMTMWMDAEGLVQWPDEQYFNSGSNPTISEMTENSNLSEYLTSTPEPPFGNPYFYDNDNPDEAPQECNSSPDLGLVVNGIEPDIVDKIDEIIDGEIDGACGKVRANGNLLYVFSFTGNL